MAIIWFLMPRCTALGAAGAHRGAGPLRREQIDALLEKLRDPALARQFLMDAGLIDSDGQLTPPYRNRDAR
jgi:hypothetical protein